MSVTPEGIAAIRKAFTHLTTAPGG
jgi:hypothetical protein